MIFCLDLIDALRCWSVDWTEGANSSGAEVAGLATRCFFDGGCGVVSSLEEEDDTDEESSESDMIELMRRLAEMRLVQFLLAIVKGVTIEQTGRKMKVNLLPLAELPKTKIEWSPVSITFVVIK